MNPQIAHSPASDVMPRDQARSVALVGPNFFSYIQAIRAKLDERGVRSEFFDERHANTIPVKILYRLGFYTIFQARKHRHLDGIAARILGGHFTDVLLIDVEVCDQRFVRKLKAAGVRVHLYMWDSARNKPRYLQYLPLLDGRSSFDPEDCAVHGLTYIPLFAEEVFSLRTQPAAVAKIREVDVSFCGTLHSNRAQRLAQLERFAKRRGLEVALQLYFHSRRLLAMKCLAVPSNFCFLGRVSTRHYSKQQIFQLFTRSKFVFDLQHPGQVGLTARTFEVLRAGTRLITFNGRAASLLPATLQDRVFVIDTIDDLARLDFAAPPPAVPTEAQDHFLSLDRFVDQLLDLMGIVAAASSTAHRSNASEAR